MICIIRDPQRMHDKLHKNTHRLRYLHTYIFANTHTETHTETHLYYIILYCVVLYYIIFISYHIILYCIILSYIILHWLALLRFKTFEWTIFYERFQRLFNMLYYNMVYIISHYPNSPWWAVATRDRFKASVHITETGPKVCFYSHISWVFSFSLIVTV